MNIQFKEIRAQVFREDNKIISWKKFLRSELSNTSIKRKVSVKHLSRFVISIVKYIELGLKNDLPQILRILNTEMQEEILILLKFLHF